MPATMQSATQRLRYRSKRDMGDTALATGCDDRRGSGGRGGGRLAADGVEPRLQGHLVQAAERQAEEDLDAVLERRESLAEGGPTLDLGALDGGRIRHAPVRGHRMPRPRRARLAGGVVARRADRGHFKSAALGALRPAPSSEAIAREPYAPH